MKILPLLFVVPLLISPLLAQEGPVITARSALLFDANSGKVLFKKNENDPRAVASTQKLLTALIVAEAGNLDEFVKVTATDVNCEPTKVGIRPGQSFTRRQLLSALLVKSGNDTARTLARDNAGSVSVFAARMNANMERLGGTNSNFMNPNGLPAVGQYSTARDMARVARAVYRNATLRQIMQTRYFPFRFPSGSVTTLRNTNRVLRTYSFCNGMKTGYTVKAGHCLISSGSYNGRDVIAVVLGSTKARVWNESASLLAYGLGIPSSQIDSFRLPSAE